MKKIVLIGIVSIALANAMPATITLINKSGCNISTGMDNNHPVNIGINNLQYSSTIKNNESGKITFEPSDSNEFPDVLQMFTVIYKLKCGGKNNHSIPLVIGIDEGEWFVNVWDFYTGDQQQYALQQDQDFNHDEYKGMLDDLIKTPVTISIVKNNS